MDRPHAKMHLFSEMAKWEVSRQNRVLFTHAEFMLTTTIFFDLMNINFGICSEIGLLFPIASTSVILSKAASLCPHLVSRPDTSLDGCPA